MNKRLVCGVGINDADYVTQVFETIGYVDGKQKRKLVWKCPFYQTWKSMIERCYSEKYKSKKPTYIRAEVTPEWHLFSTFKAWMETQDWEGNQLDKDLLVWDNKTYSPDTCVFVSSTVNMFLTEHGASRGEYMIGVDWHKGASKFRGRCNNPFTKENDDLGLFVTELAAHSAWLNQKLEHAHTLSALQTDKRVSKALIERYSNYNEKGKCNAK